jgi:hypothetical protein
LVVSQSLGSCSQIFEIENYFDHQYEISNRKNIIMPFIEILGLWPDHGRKPMERRGSKLRFLGDFTISMKFLNDRVPS